MTKRKAGFTILGASALALVLASGIAQARVGDVSAADEKDGGKIQLGDEKDGGGKIQLGDDKDGGSRIQLDEGKDGGSKIQLSDKDAG